jgi:hypothetical protein
MRNSSVWKATAPAMVAIGFAAGVAFVASCGGSGSGGGATAGGTGSPAIRHVYHAPTPASHAASGFAPTVVDTATYTPASPNDVVLGFRLRGNVTVADNPCSVGVALSIPSVLTLTMGSVSLGVGANQDFTITAPFPTLGLPSLPLASLDLQINVSGPFSLPPAPPEVTNVTFHALHLEVIVLEDVAVSDPSPRVQ